ncbi:DUF6283 family protein [Nocardia sp. NPDC005745]|uniref:DUF6283 family protein n=1 Tax=Actinomycetes TaxID=1760 RepID=UPI0033FC2FF0
MPEQLGPPAPRPCESCPYRCDVPSGVGAAEEMEKVTRRRPDITLSEAIRDAFRGWNSCTCGSADCDHFTE